jgi:AAA domain
MSQSPSALRGVSRASPCVVCNGTRRCVFSTDGLRMCRYRQGMQAGFRYFGPAKRDPAWHLYRLETECRTGNLQPSANQPDLEGVAGWALRFAARITETERTELAKHLKLPVKALDSLSTIGYEPAECCWTFPETDGKENVIGLMRRYGDGHKKTVAGSRRGLTIPEEWNRGTGPVLIVEGASDVVTLSWLGLCVVGRPSNSGGAEELAILLANAADREIVVLGEWDAKPNGQWPGRDGALQVARKLRKALRRAVAWALPPDGAKDARAWFHRHETEGSPAELGQKFIAALERQQATDALGSSALFDSAATDSDPNAVERVAMIRALAVVVEEPLKWLWPGWIARGTLTLLDGDPGLGKSTLLADVAARITRGLAMPGCSQASTGPQGVLLLTAEDDLSRVLRPRLRAAGADLDRVFSFDAVKVGEDSEPPVLPYDLQAIEKLIVERQIALVAVDPLMAFLASGIDANRDQDIRRALHRLKELAEKTDTALVAVRHLNKASSMNALYRGGGSIGIIGASRTAWLVARDPEDRTARILAMNKSNLAKTPRSLRFRVEERDHTSAITWAGETDLTAQDVLKPASVSDDDSPTLAEGCCDVLRALLQESPLPVTEAERSCREAGFTEATIRRARARLGIKVRKECVTGKWVLSLP